MEASNSDWEQVLLQNTTLYQESIKDYLACHISTISILQVAKFYRPNLDRDARIHSSLSQESQHYFAIISH